MRRLITLACLTILAACASGGSGSESTNPLVAIAGTYTLQTVNGKPLPAIIVTSATISTTVVAEQITIQVGNRWTSTRTGSTLINGQTINTSGARSGEWSLDGSTLHLMDTTQQNPSFRDGTWGGDTMTLDAAPTIHVYTRVR